MPRKPTDKDPQPKKPKGESLRIAINVWHKNVAGPEYHAAASNVLRACGNVSRERYLELFLEMEEKYPARGWKEQMDELYKFYRDKGLNLKTKADGPISPDMPLKSNPSAF